MRTVLKPRSSRSAGSAAMTMPAKNAIAARRQDQTADDRGRPCLEVELHVPQLQDRIDEREQDEIDGVVVVAVRNQRGHEGGPHSRRCRRSLPPGHAGGAREHQRPRDEQVVVAHESASEGGRDQEKDTCEHRHVASAGDHERQRVGRDAVQGQRRDQHDVVRAHEGQRGQERGSQEGGQRRVRMQRERRADGSFDDRALEENVRRRERLPHPPAFHRNEPFE